MKPMWLQWIAATATAAIVGTFTMMSYSHNTFATNDKLDKVEEELEEDQKQLKEDMIRQQQQIIQALQRMEDKIDRRTQ